MGTEPRSMPVFSYPVTRISPRYLLSSRMISPTVRVEFDQPQRAIAKGQSVVFYDGDLLVGGGIIE